MKEFEILWNVRMKNRMKGSKYLAKRFYHAALNLSLRLLQEQYEGGPSAYDKISEELFND